jgi:hypothetical protein
MLYLKADKQTYSLIQYTLFKIFDWSRQWGTKQQNRSCSTSTILVVDKMPAEGKERHVSDANGASEYIYSKTSEFAI